MDVKTQRLDTLDVTLEGSILRVSLMRTSDGEPCTCEVMP